MGGPPLLPLRATVALACASAREVGCLAGIAGEGRVDDGGGVRARRMAGGQRLRPVGARVVEVGQLLQQEARAEPLAQLLDDDIGGEVQVVPRGLGGLREAPIAVAPLVESV